MTDSVDGFRAAIRGQPLNAGDVPEEPALAEPSHLGAAQDKRLERVGAKDGAASLFLEGRAAILADGAPDRDVEWYGDAPRPSAVIGPHFPAVAHGGRWIGAELVKRPQSAERQHRFSRQTDMLEQVAAI